VIYGGNTSCLEIRADDRLVIVDVGTGIKPLGDRLMARDLKNGPINADIFISHTHWDHIMGFPMFGPLFIPGTTLRIRGPISFEDDTLESIIGTQLSYRYWPVRLSELAAKLDYEQIRETELDLGGGLKVLTNFLNHPISCLGYRFEYGGKSIVTAYDHEPFRNLFPAESADAGYSEDTAREGEAAAKEANEKVQTFFRGADILIHDAQYTTDEYSRRVGWGHSSFENAIEAAAAARVRKLVFFHHDPNHTDAHLEELEREAGAAAAEAGVEALMAREGLSVEA
jgi:ribonuclease BN (tRNA processing enzyme)